MITVKIAEPSELDCLKLQPEDVQDLAKLAYVLETLCARLPAPFDHDLANMSHMVRAWLAKAEGDVLFTRDAFTRHLDGSRGSGDAKPAA